jgi:hypothetical protein
MRLVGFALSAALLLIAGIAQNAPARSNQAQTPPAITNCASQGAAVQGVCSPASLDGTPAQVLSYQIYSGACPGSDLHIVRYSSPDSGARPAFAARWCGD